ncbi:Putative pyridoxal phosphate-dependent aminotransferase EpsN [Roseivivax jejudonensis]|uniref:GDP-perosamine synthase n=1 Tax=Roseivivax jejudonensis TaxID=1529041 RepID=A0A1X6Y6M2_9RHOB|nr:DegT/DnrJ/EryC1/StrS family aminotransferase [Roseivivax jejudonensis]SLN11554.1 Putative pyridoxal phosphate-dependent aminotransferase EpsN [Roseivivax jejudonensis]
MTEDRKFYPVSMPTLLGRELDYVTDAVQSGWVSSLGTYVTRFEEDFASFCGVEHAICVSNGTVALHLALHALGIGAGDEVIVPDLSFIATANAVLMSGAIPVFCDVEPESLGIDPARIEALITPKTRAIMPVHLYGHPAPMARILEIAQRHDLHVIEDAAEAHGSRIDGRCVGTFGACGTFSFYANKNMTTGEGGMITTDDGALAREIRVLRDHAMSPQKRYWHDRMGFNYRMTNMQAALGCAQLEQIDDFLGKRRELFHGYAERLAAVPGLRLNREAAGTTNSYWMICAEIEGADAKTRDRVCAALKTHGVDTRPYFYPMSDMPYTPGPADTPVAHQVAAQGFNLPTYLTLDPNDLDAICKTVRTVMADYRAWA